MQASKNVSIATFEVKMDSLMAMSINITDLGVLAHTSLASQSYISMIAFGYLFHEAPHSAIDVFGLNVSMLNMQKNQATSLTAWPE